MEERRRYPRLEYHANSVLIEVKTGKKFLVQTQNMSPIGLGIVAPAGTPFLVGEVVIVLADTIVMYADVVRQEKKFDGSYDIGVSAKRFTAKAVEYLYKYTQNKEED